MHTHGLLFISDLFCSQTAQAICLRQWLDVLLKVEEVPLTKSIKDLVGGKSTLQNEILGDLQLKFTSAPKGEGISFEELSLALGSDTPELFVELGSSRRASHVQCHHPQVPHYCRQQHRRPFLISPPTFVHMQHLSASHSLYIPLNSGPLCH
ncbi:hypothetical protein PAXRUDRAFT_834743 [Paxillus rubicundulus Ve08.2h10]|uniref:Fatty acid synthase subunit alpha acyl carrier domain-containing protein n=1 Tax=Paxillus rubicundulus Ve08.2h10 TaxID=930991 RepID=A0A0D0CRQ8_9AGAM|nr:hypothetical protein PAXRUDRAFT_834743 [Paxillus rubicundulus Ve08.2h10]